LFVIPEGNLLLLLFVILSAANGVPGQLAGWGRKNPRILPLLLPLLLL
jgi:hypothetical protein